LNFDEIYKEYANNPDPKMFKEFKKLKYHGEIIPLEGGVYVSNLDKPDDLLAKVKQIVRIKNSIAFIKVQWYSYIFFDRLCYFLCDFKLGSEISFFWF
jgi:hypothetical protein